MKLKQSQRARKLGMKIRAAVRAKKFKLQHGVGYLNVSTVYPTCGCAIGAAGFVLSEEPVAASMPSYACILAAEKSGLAAARDLRQMEAGFEGYESVNSDDGLASCRPLRPQNPFYRLGVSLRPLAS